MYRLWDDRAMRRVRVRAWGRVQGVFYRVSCAERARELGLSGWVRNGPDGDVEAAFEGDEAAVTAMLAWCRDGPPSARVDRLDVEGEAVTGGEGFRITR
jgi:acylphosphatase